METSARSACDLDEDEDMDSFLKTIKLHDRFVTDYNNEDEESFSDEDSSADSDNLLSREKGHFSKQERDYRSILSSEAKAETLSMLDSVRSSCEKSGHGFSLDVLNLKSDASGLGDLDGALLGESLCCHRPPFGDPLSEDDILSSALNLLEEEKCRKFRAVGLFDRSVVNKSISIEAEKLLEDGGTHFTEQKLILKPFQQKTPETSHSSLDVLTSVMKSQTVPEFEDLSTRRPELSETISSDHQEKHPQRNCLEEKKCSSADNDISANGCSVGDNSFGVSVAKSVNQDPKQKLRSKKGNVKSAPTAKTTKSKKVPTKKIESGSDSKTEEIKFSSEEKSDDVKDTGATQSTDCSNVSNAVTAVQELPLGDIAFIEDEGTDENFTTVCSKKKFRMRKDAYHSVDLDSNVELAKEKSGMHLRCSRRSAFNVAAHSASFSAPSSSVTSRPTSKSFRSNCSMSSEHSSCSSFSETSRIVSNTSGKSKRLENQKLSNHLSKSSESSLNKTWTHGSYASALSQNLPAPSINEDEESADFASVTESFDVEAYKLLSPHSSEIETEGLLSPPQSEADTGFSSASSLSADEALANSVTQKKTEIGLEEPFILSSSSEKTNASLQMSPSSRKSVDQESVSSDSSNPMPSLNLKPQPSVERHNLEISLCRESVAWPSQPLVTPYRETDAVFFDTRKQRFNYSSAPSDISFGYDSGDECIHDGLANPGTPYSLGNTADVKDITFFAGSANGTDSADRIKSDFSDVLSSETFQQNAENCEPSDQSSPQVVDGSTTCTKSGIGETSGDNNESHASVCQLALQREPSEERLHHPKDGHAAKLSLSSEDNDATTRTVASSSRRFDLRAAQKFLRRAFENVLRQESEHPDRFLRF